MNDYNFKLFDAAKSGESTLISSLIREGADATSTDIFGWSPIHYACQRGHIDTVLALINSGSELNPKEKFGWTPLHVAGRFNKKETALILIANGAASNDPGQMAAIPDLIGLTMRQAAIQGGFVQRLHHLINNERSTLCQDHPQALIDFARLFNQKEAIAILQSSMAATAIDEVTHSGVRIHAPWQTRQIGPQF